MSEHEAEKKRVFTPNAIHLVRTTQQINVALSQMADQKASILMGATFVVFTLSVGQASREGLSIALFVLIGFAFLSAMLAVFAIMPSVKPRPDMARNIMFFGYFTQIPEEEFIETMLDNLDCDESLYRAMLHDMYQNGLVLQHKKYRYLGYAYRTFLMGLVLTLIFLMAESFGTLS
jgi:Family of unknown function (DUF5706)